MTSSEKDNLIDAAEIAGGIILGGIAVALFEAGFHIAGFVFSFLAVGFGLAVAAHHLEKFGLKNVRNWFIASLILMAVLFGFLAFHRPPTEPKPHFKFLISSKNSTDFSVELTNSFLFFTNADPVRGVLVVPKPIGERNVMLKLWIFNDSLTNVENLLVAVTLPKKWHLKMDGWESCDDTGGPLRSIDTNSPETQAFSITSNAKLIPDGIVGLPPIGITLGVIEPITSQMAITFEADGVPRQNIEFNVFFWPPSTNFNEIEKPFVKLATPGSDGFNINLSSNDIMTMKLIK